MQQIEVFPCRSWLEVSAPLDSVDRGTFEVEDGEMVGGSLESVPHHHELDWILVFHAHGVDPVDASQQTFIVLGNALEVLLLDASEGLEVLFCHGLDDELLILREEEETATFA